MEETKNKVPYGYVRITGGEFKDQIGWCDDEEFMEEEPHEVDEAGDSGANAGVVYFQPGLDGSFEVIPVRYLESLVADSAEVKRLEESWTPYWLRKLKVKIDGVELTSRFALVPELHARMPKHEAQPRLEGFIAGWNAARSLLTNPEQYTREQDGQVGDPNDPQFREWLFVMGWLEHYNEHLREQRAKRRDNQT